MSGIENTNVSMIMKNKEQEHVSEVSGKPLEQPELLKQQFQQLAQESTPKPAAEQAQQPTLQQKLMKQPLAPLQEVPEQLSTPLQQISLPQLQPAKPIVPPALQHRDDTSSTHSLSEYLAQLLKDHRQLSALPNIFMHIDRLLDEEIANVRASLFSLPKHSMVLPPPEGPIVVLNEKVYVPVKEYPDFNFVGRLLGPRGMTAKQLEIDTGCKIMVRGKGSMRNKHEEETNRGKPNWEHLSDELHILITAEDTENRAKIKLEQAVNEIKKFLVPLAEGEDELKKRQLMELAIINGTYRDTTTRNTSSTNFPHCCEGDWRRRPAGCGPASAADSHMIAANTAIAGMQGPVRAPNPPTLGTPFILSQLAATPAGAGAAGAYTDGPQTPHMILVPYGDCANYAAFTSNTLLNEYNESNMSGLKEHQRRVASRNHANRHQVGIAGKNGYRVN